MRAAGIDARMRQQRLGHESLDMTEGIYTHTYAQEDQDVARRMGDLLTGDNFPLAGGGGYSREVLSC
jgi:integrase